MPLRDTSVETTGTTPATVGQLTGPWLTSALRRSGVIGSAGDVEILAHEPLTTGTAFATRMYRLRLEGPRGCPATAILKLPVTGAIREFIDGVGAYAREVSFYTELAADVPVNVPGCYIAEMSAHSTDFVLLLEDLSDVEPADQLAGLTLEQAEATLELLARFHAWSWNHGRLDPLAPVFPPLDGPVGRAAARVFARFYSAAWPAAREALGDQVSPAVADLAGRLPELLPSLIEKLGSPRTITHGELRADNLFIAPDGEMTMIDFQTVGQASGMLDVSYLLSQSVRADVRSGNDEALVRRYWEALRTFGVSDYSWDDAHGQYRAGVAYNAIWAGMAYGEIDRLDERGRALVMEMLRRACTAMDENDCPGALS